MIKKPNKKLIGFFSITSIILFLAIIISLSGIKAFRLKDDKLVMFFNESINGLSIGSPVSFRGVEIGQVIKIDLIPETTLEPIQVAVIDIGMRICLMPQEKSPLLISPIQVLIMA